MIVALWPLLLLLCGCVEEEDVTLDYQRLHDLEPGRAGCTITESEDRDGNGFGDFDRLVTYDAAGLPVLVRETETDNGGQPPVDPNTFRIDTEFDDRGNPVMQQEGPDDESPRTLTAWRWQYDRTVLRHTGEVDRRNNGEDIVIWTWEYDNEGLGLSWEIDATGTTGLVIKMSYLWDEQGVFEVRRFDSLTDGGLAETARWSLEGDGFGRVVRRVEVEDGVEGRQALYTRDEAGRLIGRVGGWGPLGEWASAEVVFTSPCFED